MVMYVDDGYVVDAFSPAADKELETLHAKFTIETSRSVVYSQAPSPYTVYLWYTTRESLGGVFPGGVW